jgi:hypothetical protein
MNVLSPRTLTTRLASESGWARGIRCRKANFPLRIVAIAPNRGAIVPQLSPNDIDELFAIRALLEP